MAGEVLPSSGKPNKIVYGGETLIDLTADTVTPGTLKKGVTAHAADGSRITGTMAQPEPVQESDINFYDYDGTLLHAWSLAELQGKTELPELPTQPGLICQGWNWTLADLKSLGRKMNVGAIYTTDDGATRLHLNIPIDNYAVSLQFYQLYNSSTQIDWGDGTAPETSYAHDRITMPHTYANAGRYILSLKSLVAQPNIAARPTGRIAAVCEEINIGEHQAQFRQYSWSAEGWGLKRISFPASYQYSTVDALQGVRYLEFVALPSGVTVVGTEDTAHVLGNTRIVSLPKSVVDIKDFAFRNNYILENFYIPNDACAMGKRVFENSNALKDMVLPASMTEIKFQLAYQVNCINTVKIPDGVASIGGNAFWNCVSLTHISFPAALASIGDAAFENCTSAMWYDFTACSAVPTLGANAFNAIPADCEIRVPAALLSEWKAATNWATYADHIVGV